MLKTHLLTKSKKNQNILHRYLTKGRHYDEALYQLAYDDISTKESLQRLKDDRVMWNSPDDTVEKAKRVIEEEDTFLSKPAELEEGVLECPRCGSTKTFSFTKQVRSADEGMTVFGICSKCGKNWRE